MMWLNKKELKNTQEELVHYYIKDKGNHEPMASAVQYCSALLGYQGGTGKVALWLVQYKLGSR
jgi:hypothetical protein